jgi:Zn-dependent protease with chaperone function
MNFFQHQAEARSRSRRLVVLFVLAVIAIVLAIDLVVLLALSMGDAKEARQAAGGPLERHAGAVLVASVLTLAVIGIASLTKVAKLRAGGGAIARDMGGTLVADGGGDPALRRLRNVVEEIAIASGVPVPEIYVLDHEPGINAFAAGFSPADAAVAVTRGALDKLNRDELQGVIAHEFSHILNGDMRLNIRLMGVLFGILLLGIIGREFLLRIRGGNNKNAGAIVLIALGVMVIGYVGLFFGRLIKAGVSRQREYLADASAVQFTRQNAGIAGALKKIGAFAQGSKFSAANAEEVSHMLFGDGVGYSALFATHPPLHERIRRVDPRFDPGELAVIAKQWSAVVQTLDEGPGASVAGLAAARELGRSEQPPRARRPEPAPAAPATDQAVAAGVVAQVGNPADDDYRLAARIAEQIPEKLRVLAHMHERAPDLVLALALDRDAEPRRGQLLTLGGALGGEAVARIEALHGEIAALHPLQRLPLAALAFPALRRRPRAELERLVGALDTAIHADGRVHLSEYCLAKLLGCQVIDALDPSRAQTAGSLKPIDVRAHVVALLATFARHGHDAEESARRAFVAGMAVVFPHARASFDPPADWHAALDAALPALDRLGLVGKQLLIEALVATLAHDQRLSVAESELLRVVCAALHCPLPPALLK